MKIHVNGVDREATAEEIAAHEKLCNDAKKQNDELNDKNE